MWPFTKKITYRDCDNCSHYARYEGAWCHCYMKPLVEAKKECDKGIEDCLSCSNGYGESCKKKICDVFNTSLANMAVIAHPAATDSWDCIYWEELIKAKKNGAVV